MSAKLRLVQFESGGQQRVGVELANGDSVVDVTAVDPSIPSEMKAFLEQWETSLKLAARCVCVCVCMRTCIAIVNIRLE